MTKNEAEKIVRHFAREWAKREGYRPGFGNLPSYYDIRALVQRSSPEALRFRSVMGASEDIERWIDSELGVSGN